jgi:catechol 2,3-dioxygenase-like lactoylglutathione lyase family enzyme
MSNKRSGALGVHSIDHFGLQVPDLEEARTFYTAFGLEVRDHEAGLRLFTHGHNQCWARITQGPHKQLRYLSFGVYPDDEATLLERLKGNGTQTRAVVPGGPDCGTWITGFDGLPIHLCVAEKCSPDTRTQVTFESSASGASGAVFNSAAPPVRPRRLSHFAIYTSDVIAATRWYEDNLGLRLSDGSGPVVAFLHGAHGSDHHLLALVGSTHRGMHHASWDVGSVQEVGLGSAQMMRAGYKRGWGVGRHVLGGNYFYYATDPWGSHSEYSADIDFIPHDVDWPAKSDHPPEDSFYLWGPDVPEGFVDNTEPEGYAR